MDSMLEVFENRFQTLPTPVYCLESHKLKRNSNFHEVYIFHSFVDTLERGFILRNRERQSMKKDKEIEAYLNGELDRQEQMKYEIAKELGVLDQVLENGWKSLSAKDTGRIGGLMTGRKKLKNSKKSST